MVYKSSMNPDANAQNVPPHLQAIMKLAEERNTAFRIREYLPFLLMFLGGFALEIITDLHATTMLIAVVCSATLIGISERRAERRFQQIVDILNEHQKQLQAPPTAKD